MREIRFRAINTWFGDSKMEYFDLENAGDYIRMKENSRPNEKWEVMQYTGFKDKNGKEIYEGDILKIDEDDYRDEVIGEISYDSFTYKLKRNPQSDSAKKAGYIDYIRFWKDGTNDWYTLEQIQSYQIEVIGNIYENPELLK